MSTSLDRVATLVALVAALVLGLSAGASLTEGAILVPYWRSLPAQGFLSWFRDNEPHLVAFFGPLQGASVILTIVAAGLYGLRRRTGTSPLIVAAILTVAVLVTYTLYFRDTNASFVAGTIPPDAVADELARWATWHWVRTMIGISALVAALLAIRQS